LKEFILSIWATIPHILLVTAAVQSNKMSKEILNFCSQKRQTVAKGSTWLKNGRTVIRVKKGKTTKDISQQNN
jgi:hypothetical protein